MAGLDNTAILFADLQDTIVPHSGTNEEAALRRSAKALAGFARDLGIPSVISVVPFGTDSPQPIAELREALPNAPVIVRRGPRIYAHPPSVDAIRKTGCKTLIVAGVATEVVVLHATLEAISAGLSVHVLVDASGGFDARTEAAALRELEKAGAVTSSIASFVTRHVATFDTPDGKAAISALMTLMGG
jgi:nicotinamidase-related amidase